MTLYIKLPDQPLIELAQWDTLSFEDERTGYADRLRGAVAYLRHGRIEVRLMGVRIDGRTLVMPSTRLRIIGSEKGPRLRTRLRRTFRR